MTPPFCEPGQKPHQTETKTHQKRTTMSEDITKPEATKPEAISDEQLEDVAGGVSDTVNINTQNCAALSVSIAVA
jgi:hypothetical protein